MTSIMFQLNDYLSRLRARALAPRLTGNWSLGGARPNPELGSLEPSRNMLDLLLAVWRRYRVRRRWQRDLRTMDDRQLRDIGVSRLDAERAIKQFRFWI